MKIILTILQDSGTYPIDMLAISTIQRSKILWPDWSISRKISSGTPILYGLNSATSDAILARSFHLHFGWVLLEKCCFHLLGREWWEVVVETYFTFILVQTTSLFSIRLILSLHSDIRSFNIWADLKCWWSNDLWEFSIWVWKVSVQYYRCTSQIIISMKVWMIYD